MPVRVWYFFKLPEASGAWWSCIIPNLLLIEQSWFLYHPSFCPGKGTWNWILNLRPGFMAYFIWQQLNYQGLVSHHSLLPHRGTLEGSRRSNLLLWVCLISLFSELAVPFFLHVPIWQQLRTHSMRVSHSSADPPIPQVFCGQVGWFFWIQGICKMYIQCQWLEIPSSGSQLWRKSFITAVHTSGDLPPVLPCYHRKWEQMYYWQPKQ